MALNIEGKEKFINDFETFSDLYLKNDSLNTLRKNSIQRFSELGFPTTKNEEWKYTSVSSIAKTNFRFASPSDKFTLTKTDIEKFLLCGKEATVLVFENGKFNESLSEIKNLPKNVVVASLANSLENESVKQHLGKYASIKTESFIALNSAFIYDGAFIHIPANVIVEQPIHLLYVNDARAEATVVYPRNLIVAEKSSQVKIAESYHNISSVNHHFVNSVTEGVVDV